MRTRGEFLRSVLIVLGFMGIVIGLASVILGVGLVRPQVDDALTQVDQNLNLMSQSLTMAERHFSLIENTAALSQSASEIIKLLPETLSSTRGALLQGAQALEVTGGTLDDVVGGLPGLVLPNDQVEKNATAARKAADQLRLVSGMVSEIQDASVGLKGSSLKLSSQLASVQEDLPAALSILQGVKAQVQQTRSLMQDQPLAWIASGAVAFAGGLYFILGCFCLVLAEAHRKMSALSVEGGRLEAGKSDRGEIRRAA